MTGVLNHGSLKSVQERIRQAALSAGRKPEDVRIVAVTKKFPADTMLSAVNGGLTLLGESRVQETELKLPGFSRRNDTELHLIGHLQSNKVRKAVELFDVIQTVDSQKLGQRINRIAHEAGKVQRVYLQVNTGHDPAKFGVSPETALNTAGELSQLPGLKLEGIMMIAPLLDDPAELKAVFAGTREIRDRIREQVSKDCQFLSMGMTADFELAVQQGATHVRLGTALFGKRPV